MGKSFKKNCGGKWNNSDKFSKRVYHKKMRSLAKLSCEEFSKRFTDEESLDYINFNIRTGYWYGEGVGDVWCWTSDGSNTWECDISSIRRELESYINLPSNFEIYKKLINKKFHYYIRPWNCRIINMIIDHNLSKKIFISRKEMVDWLFNHEEYLIKLLIKLDYGK